VVKYWGVANDWGMVKDWSVVKEECARRLLPLLAEVSPI